MRLWESEGGLFEFGHRFGSVTGFFKPAPSPKPRQNSKTLAPHGYSFSSKALGGGIRKNGELFEIAENIRRRENLACALRFSGVGNINTSHENQECQAKPGQGQNWRRQP